MRCLKSFGERIASRDPDRQTAESRIRIALMNRFNALGQAEIERGAQDYRGKGMLVSKTTCATTPTQGGRLTPPSPPLSLRAFAGGKVHWTFPSSG